MPISHFAEVFNMALVVVVNNRAGQQQMWNGDSSGYLSS